MVNCKIDLIQSLLVSYTPFSNNNNNNNNNSNSLIPLNLLFDDIILPKSLKLIDERRINAYFITNTTTDVLRGEGQDSELDRLISEYIAGSAHGHRKLEYVILESYEQIHDGNDNNNDAIGVDDVRGSRLINVDLDSWFCSCLQFNDKLKSCDVRPISNMETGQLGISVFHRGRGLPQYYEPDKMEEPSKRDEEDEDDEHDPLPPVCSHLIASYLLHKWITKKEISSDIVSIHEFVKVISLEDWLNQFVSQF
ncbi:hypothetical protein WICPIJ_002641 [Wickerhamomyces pijperi]|uniref:Uncharacterized protein n=1 Tax=Wickerhamomyces pijperi TaxID=599730 RepID=A0A9P8TNS0_WICPI|nr:hypothetical protein WICPIJ_002641 [Wickerhamomyces pijperi]